MTAGAGSWPSPYREQRDFSLALEMTEKKNEMTAGALSRPSPYREGRDDRGAGRDGKKLEVVQKQKEAKAAGRPDCRRS